MDIKAAKKRILKANGKITPRITKIALLSSSAYNGAKVQVSNKAVPRAITALLGKFLKVKTAMGSATARTQSWHNIKVKD